MKKHKWLILLSLFILSCTTNGLIAQQHAVLSPDGNLKLSVDIGNTISYEVEYKGNKMIKSSNISITLEDGRTLGHSPTILSVEDNEVDRIIELPYGIAKSITENYSEKIINFQEDFALVLRAYDEGVAYRFVTKLTGDIIVQAEQAEFNIVEDPQTWYPLADDLMRSFERAYEYYPKVSDIKMKDDNGNPTTSMAITPTLFSYNQGGVKLIIGESDVSDYPGLYIDRTDESSTKMVGKWAAYPKVVSDPNDIYKYHRVEERYDYIAKTTGARTFPWRVIIATDDDKSLLTNQLIFKLARPLEIANTDWIKPGKSVWEWWHDAILEGVDESGKVSLEVYKYYIDYGAKYGFEYLTMDSQWSTEFASEVIEYAASKNMRVITWDFINMPIEDPNRLDFIKSLGVAGIKVDLIERDDQIAMNWVETLAKECAKRELLLVLHGCPTPTGLERAYPNIINYEAVRGAECLKWDNTPNPDYHVEIPFIRMLAGPVDYTPGSMRNVQVDKFKPIPTGIPNSMGTRSHEIAMYIMYHQPMAYFCDSPIEYAKHPSISKFFEVLPTVWDQSIPLSAEVGKYALIARNHGKDWFVGGMTNTEARSLDVNFSFLPAGNYTATIYKDNKYSRIDAKIQDVEVMEINNSMTISMDMVRSGGFVMYLSADGNSLIEQETVTEIAEDIVVYVSEDKSQLIVQTKVENIKNVHVFDTQGKLQLKSSTDNYTDPKRLVINSLNLPNGVYATVIETDKKVHKIRFIK